MSLRPAKYASVAILLVAYALFLIPIVANQLDDNIPFSVLAGLVSVGVFVAFPILIGFVIIKVATRKHQDEVLDWRLDIAVIGLLFLAVAAPGALEDKQRTKLAHVRLMMREAALTIETYHDMAGELPALLDQLESYPTTSIKKEALRDPYSPEGSRFAWIILDATSGAVVSTGPDGVLDWTNEREHILYDPTNGVKSPGDLVRYVNR